jgi:hypothetical protein
MIYLVKEWRRIFVCILNTSFKKKKKKKKNESYTVKCQLILSIEPIFYVCYNFKIILRTIKLN